MKHPRVFVIGIISGLVGLTSTSAMAEMPEEQLIERGKYLVVITGCNDCHTNGYLQSEGEIPEEQWLTGNPVGWRGPWGTTYGSNLRNLVQSLTAEQWLSPAQTMKARPPMPWFNLNAMNKKDALAIYRYIRDLGPAGEPAPAYVPPDQEPDTLYSDLTPRRSE
jgi:mono/diheme cytochrome c family protein